MDYRIPICYPDDPDLQHVWECWVRFEHEQYTPDPGASPIDHLLANAHGWEARHPRVRAAWEELIDPKNLRGLEKWNKQFPKKNPTAQEATDWALKCCRERAKKHA